MNNHINFSIKPCGFFVDKEAPYLGATPDGLVECSCCGVGVIEIKCPWCTKDAPSLEHTAEQNKRFCLQKLDSGLRLSRDHPYFMQCQLQMHVTGYAYCDFIVWQESDLHIERLMPDRVTIQAGLQRAETFFKLCVLPELRGKWFTRTLTTAITSMQVCDVDEEDGGTWCFCKESRGGNMVGCDNSGCPIKWFHMSCLKMEAA